MRISRWLLAFIGLAVLWLASLTAATRDHRANDFHARPGAQEQKPSAEDIEKGRELAENVCQACHELGPDLTAGRGAEAWKKVVEEMRLMGAQLSDEEAALVTAYLIQTYPAK
jgi:mono/diheme cytochrome c family protein